MKNIHHHYGMKEQEAYEECGVDSLLDVNLGD